MKKSITPLGETEMEVLHHVWDLQDATVADVHERILSDRKVAYTTVMTVMKNLKKKGISSIGKMALLMCIQQLKSPKMCNQIWYLK